MINLDTIKQMKHSKEITDKKINMKKKDILGSYRIDVLDNNTIFIQNRYFNFSYMKANNVVKDELKDKYRYFGGLQCEYSQDSENYKNLEKWLCEIAEKNLNQ